MQKFPILKKDPLRQLTPPAHLIMDSSLKEAIGGLTSPSRFEKIKKAAALIVVLNLLKIILYKLRFAESCGKSVTDVPYVFNIIFIIFLTGNTA